VSAPPKILRGPYLPEPGNTRTKNTGNVADARKFFFEYRPPNLSHLLRQRYSWMHKYLADKEKVVEIGCGTGLSREFIDHQGLVLTDVEDHAWVDMTADALNMPFDDGELEAVISVHMIHHLANPRKFFREMARVLKPGGLLIIQEIQSSLVTRVVIRLMRIEGWSYEVDVFSNSAVVNDPRNAWSGNNSVPELLFSDSGEFERNIAEFSIIHNKLCECFSFLVSGGVVAKSPTLPLPKLMLSMISMLDQVVIRLLPSVFAMERQVVIQKRP